MGCAVMGEGCGLGVGLVEVGFWRFPYLPHATAQKTGGVVKWAV